MKGSVVKKGNKYYAVFDLPPEVTIDPATGRTKKRRRQKWVGGYDRRRDAEEALTRFVYQANTGELVEPSNVTLGEWLDTWLEMEIKPPRRRPGTYERYEQIVRLHLKPALGAIPLQKLTPVDVQRYQDAKVAAGVPVKTVELHHVVLHGALEAAAGPKYQLILRNPARHVTVEALDTAEEAEDEAMRVWSPDEAKAFLAAAEEQGIQEHAFFSLALETGMRKGELCALKWEDLDWKAGTITVRRTLRRIERDGTPVFGPPKKPRNKRGTGKRTLVLTPEMLALLRKHRAHQNEVKMRYRQGAAPYRDHGLIFAREPKGWERPLLPGAPLDYHHMGERLLDPLIKKAGVPRIRFHDLRHTAATLALRAGVPLKVVSDRLGHAGIEITANLYQHVLPDMQEEAAAKVRSLLS